jgi:Xaa-Pro aminopeptidase
MTLTRNRMAVPAPAHREVQAIAKAILAEIVDSISSASTERTISDTAQRMLAARGLPDSWYYQCPALVLLGNRSCLSVSGWAYVPGDEQVGDFNLVTIDLSPRRGPWWGDCARTIFVEDGVASATPRSPEFVAGQNFIVGLHRQMQEFVTPGTTFRELYEFANARIADGGYDNLDFLGNMGHSVASRSEDRLFIEQNNFSLLSDVSCFTFEPHVRLRGGRWGYKHENIYFFNETGQVEEL